MTVFLDTVGLLAVWDQSDQWHDAAERCFQELVASRADLITSTSILLECGNAAARRPYRPAVNRLRRNMEEAGRLIAPSADDWDAGGAPTKMAKRIPQALWITFRFRLCDACA